MNVTDGNDVVRGCEGGGESGYEKLEYKTCFDVREVSTLKEEVVKGPRLRVMEVAG